MISIAPLLSEKGLDNINNHKYKPSELTPLDDALAPWLNWLVEFFPLWMAPNVVTVAGVGPVLLVQCLLFWHCPTGVAPTEQVPSWILLSFTAAAPFYIVMDALDGKQARRTGSSSPLGQLFDHGVDCLTMLPYAIFFMSAVGATAGRLHLAGQISSHIGFFLAQWQEHHTGIMATKFGPVGVTEIGFSMAGFVMMGGMMEPQLRYHYSSGLSPLGVSWADTFVIGWLAFAAILALCSLITVFGALGQRHGLRAIGRAALDLAPILMLVFGAFVWDDAFCISHSRWISCLTAILAFLVTAQMILSSMALVEYQWLQPMSLLYIPMALSSRLLTSDLSEMALMVLTLASSVITLGWLVQIIQQLTTRLGVQVFFIKKRAVE